MLTFTNLLIKENALHEVDNKIPFVELQSQRISLEQKLRTEFWLAFGEGRSSVI